MKLVSFYLIIILTQESTVEAAKETSTTAATRVWQAYYAHTHTHEIIQECCLCWEWNPRMRPKILQADKLF